MKKISESLMQKDLSEADSVDLGMVDNFVTKVLVEKGIVSSEEAEKLNKDRIDELIVRSAHDFKNLPDIVPKTNKDKARKILGLAVEKGVANDLSKRNAEIQAAEKEMHNYLGVLRQKFPFVRGFVLCGSRFSPHKIPTHNSDIDVIVILDEGKKAGSDSDEGRKTVSELVGYARNQKTESGLEVELDGFQSEKGLFHDLDSDVVSTELRGKWIWGWDSSAIRYIGESIMGQSEATVNETIQNKLNSKASQEQKNEIIRMAKRTLIPEAQRAQSALLRDRKNEDTKHEAAARVLENAEIERIKKGLIK